MPYEHEGDGDLSAAAGAATSVASHRSHARGDRRTGFFVAMAGTLVAIVAVGFTPSFYLKAYFEAGHSGAAHRALPAHLIAHGVVLTLWFLLFLVQTVAVASRRIVLHRLLGTFGAGLAAAVVAASMVVVVRLAARATARGVTAGPVALIVTGDTGLMILFAGFVVAAISFRRRPEVHRRLMLLASVTIVGPALARLPGAEALIPLSVVVPQLALFSALVTFDIVSSRRLHPVTAWGVVLYLIVAATSTAAGFSEFGRAYVKALA